MDNGSGMEADTVAKAFEPFFTTKGIGKGTGLGLSQVYGFVRQAGGTVRIITSPQEGTTVELILPRSKEPPTTECAGAYITSDQETSAGEVILVVEDEASVRGTAVESLESLGYTTLAAPDAAVALERLLDGSRVDVLFSDIVMPGMNGIKLATEARRLRPELKILLTSGYTGTAMRRELPDNTPLLPKPYDSGQLARCVRSVLHGHSDLD
jgi:CheY-like chemotaxis protein